jgi:cytochrome c oxidase cbb3-type subunit 3
MKHAAACIAFTTVLLASCHREKRLGDAGPAVAAAVESSGASELQAGVTIPPVDAKNPFEGNYDAMNQGRRLFSQFNCAGCHSPGGGGGIGPPLIDEKWVYGNNPAKIYETIVRGRPNGMPSFGGRIPSYQVWQIVTFVRNMSNEASDPKGRK